MRLCCQSAERSGALGVGEEGTGGRGGALGRQELQVWTLLRGHPASL